MKKISLVLLLLVCFSFLHAQNNPPSSMQNKISSGSDSRVHKGFHFEFGIGPAFGTITDEAVIYGTPGTLEFGGTGVGIDMKIGGSLQENLMLTFDILSKAIVSPELKVNGTSIGTSNSVSLGEVSYGGGLTYYLMPSDVFLSATLGTGTFVIRNTQNNTTTRADYGFSMQLKVGKHWWISNKWGIGLSGAYGTTSAHDSGHDGVGSYSDDISSSRFVIAVSIGVR
jgi:hypothetical protein